MLLKYSQVERRTKASANSKQRATGAMKLTVGIPTPRVNRKVMKGFATKRTALGQQRLTSARTQERTTVDPCDNSNDSGLGFDHHLEFQLAARSSVKFADQEVSWLNEHSEVKRKKLEIKLESDDANDNFSFPETMSRRDKRGEEAGRLAPKAGDAVGHAETAPAAVPRTPGRPQAIVNRRSAGVSLASQLPGMSRDSKTHLQILCQPEQQHRARYQTEGSRGAVKDRSGNGFPVVKLVGYNKPATLQVFIGTDVGRVAPHMFYQACRVSGKNSTPCVERKIDGTIVIEVDFDPAKDMVITCDCVGILKERNVDVEHRFPDQSGSRNKKKSTRCRMVFRTTITHPDDTIEILQTTSQPIVCTQPPGVPEICKKSLSACPCTGGMELFVLGKNFLKDTRVVFQDGDAMLETPWEESVQPDKEFLQQTHLVCVVPPYRRLDIIEPVTIRLLVVSSGKTSEPHTFTYTPTLQPSALTPEGTQPCVTLAQSSVSHRGADVPQMFARSTIVPGTELMLHDTGPSSVAAGPGKSSPKKSQYLPIEPAQIGKTEIHPVMMWQSSSLVPPPDTQNPDNKALETKELERVLSGKMMPPPLLPIGTRRASSHLRLIVPDTDAASMLAEKLKTEMTEETSSHSPEDVKGIDLRMKPTVTMNSLASVADLSSTQSPTMATFQQFVTGCTNAPLPNQSAQSVEKYLSNLECATDTVVVTKTASDCLAPSSKLADTVASTAPEICLSTDTGSPSQFDSASTLFGQQHSAIAQGSLDPKLQYASDVPISVLYNAQTAAKTTGQESKLQFPSEETALLQQEQVTASRRKSVFDETLAIPPSTDTVLGGRRPIMVLQESQSVPIMNTVNEASALLHTASGLIYGSPDRGATSSLLPVSTQSTETDVLDSLSKRSRSVGIVGTVSDSAILSGPSPVLSDHMLAVTQPSVITSPTSVRVDAVVSSAVNSHVMGSDNCVHSSNTDKLDALVNSSAVGHMIPAPVSPSDNIVLRSTPIEAHLRQQEIKTTDQMSPLPVTEMPDTGLGSFDLLPGQHSSVQISRENAQLLNDTMSATVNSHLLVTNPKAEIEAGVQLSTSSLSSTTGNALYTSHGQASPIAMKNLILNSSIGTTSEGQILVASPIQTSPVSLKSMLLESSDAVPHNHILASGSTSSIAAAPQMLIPSPTSASMENIMTSAIAQQGGGHTMATGLTCTSPVGMKNMIFESAASDSCLANPSHTSPIAVKTMILNSHLSGNVDERVIPRTADQSAHISAQNTRLGALVQSTLNGHTFVVSNGTQVTSTLDVHPGDGIAILSEQGHVQQSSEIRTTSPLISQPSACITTLITQASEPSSHLPLPAGTTDGTLINTVFTSRSPTDPCSSLQVHSFSKEGVLRIEMGPQTPCCTNGTALHHASQFTTASSHSQSTVTGITMSSKLAEEIAEQSRNTSSQFVTQVLLGLAAHDKMKKDSEIALMSRDKITDSLQQVDFSDSKVPETRLFAAPEMLKVAVDDLLKSTVGNVPNSHCQGQVTTMSDLVLTKQQEQEVQGQQCKEQQQHSPVPQTKTCVTENTAANPALSQKKGEEGMVPQELTQMSENDLLSYINPSAFDQV